MRMRVLVVAVTAGVVGVVALGSRSANELTGELGLTGDPAFTARLSGGLYDARTLRDVDGAVDIAYLTTDAPLNATIAAAGSSGVARVQLRVDGRSQTDRVTDCRRRRCPTRLVVRLRPRIMARGEGEHRIDVLAAGSGRRRAIRVASFTVNAASRQAPAAEVEPRAPARAAPPSGTRGRAVDAIVRAAFRRGDLARLLGRSALVLRERGRGGGVVTILADVRPTRHGVRALLPQLDDGAARMRSGGLRDLVIDVDVRGRRVVGVQPGPASQVRAWATTASPPGAPVGEDDVPSSAFSTRHGGRLLKLSDRGPAFFGQDGDPAIRRSGRDWPVSLVFTGAATVAKVKAGLRRIGLVRRGHARYLGYQTGTGVLRFDGDRGLKNACDPNATDLHARVYAPAATDRFADPDLGTFVVATVHLDQSDGCGAGPQQFGFSERAERRLAELVASGLRWRVRINDYPLGNGEPLRRDSADPRHIWLSDGRATSVVVP